MIWNLITGFLPDVWPWILGALGIGTLEVEVDRAPIGGQRGEGEAQAG